LSKIAEFENIPEISVDGGETLEEATAECKALFEKYNMELYNGEVSLAQCAEARMVLLVHPWWAWSAWRRARQRQ